MLDIKHNYMKRILFSSFLAFPLVIFFASCGDVEPGFTDIFFQNNSNDTIALLRRWINLENKKEVTISNCKIIFPSEMARITSYENGPESRSEVGLYEIAIYKCRAEKSNSLESEYQLQELLCQYTLSAVEMDSLDNVIPYPPTAKMKDVEMAPSYEELVETKSQEYILPSKGNVK